MDPTIVSLGIESRDCSHFDGERGMKGEQGIEREDERDEKDQKDGMGRISLTDTAGIVAECS